MEVSRDPKDSRTPEDAAFERMDTTHEHKNEGGFSDTFRFLLIALLIVLPVRFFIAQPFIVSGASMETTFSTGEYLIVDQLTYRFEEPRRGDVIIFKYPKDTSKYFIKRIIGLPGDTIAISGHTVTISNDTYPDGVALEEGYILDARPLGNLTQTLGEEEYFVMGDNRDASSDSRSWGVLTRDKIVGRALLRLFPLDAIGVLPGRHDLEAEMSL